MNIDTLKGKALDLAVAAFEVMDRPDYVVRDGQPAFEAAWDPEGVRDEDDLHGEFKMWRHYKPSTCWDEGGPIIEREKIRLLYQDEPYGRKEITPFWTADIKGGAAAYGSTPLLAAMRCYVKSKLGVRRGGIESDAFRVENVARQIESARKIRANTSATGGLIGERAHEDQSPQTANCYLTPKNRKPQGEK